MAIFGQKWAFQIYSDNFPQKDWYKFGMAKIFFWQFSQKDWYKIRMAKNGCSEFFLTIFPKRTGINLEWPKMAIPNYSNNFSQKDWYKFRMAKNGHSEFFPTIFPKKTGINSEWPKMAILNFF